MFIKYLSDSLGGLRLDPSKIYAPGVTIRSPSPPLRFFSYVIVLSYLSYLIYYYLIYILIYIDSYFIEASPTAPYLVSSYLIALI